jgi:CBS domain containing-hemolysin-like protein
MVQQTNGKATAAMVLGIVSIPLFFLSFLDLGLAIPAIVLGAIGLRDAKRNPQRGGRGRALSGVICGSIGLLLIIILLVVVISRIAPCFHSGGGVSQSCVNDHL